MEDLSNNQHEEPQSQRRPCDILSHEGIARLNALSDVQETLTKAVHDIDTGDHHGPPREAEERPKSGIATHQSHFQEAEESRKRGQPINNFERKSSPMAQSEVLWPGINTQTPQVANKRLGSPLSTTAHLVKRHQSDELIHAPRHLESPIILSNLPKELPVPENVYARNLHGTPAGSGISSQPQCLHASRNGFEGYPEWSSTPPPLSNLGSSPHFGFPSEFDDNPGQFTSARPYSSLNGGSRQSVINPQKLSPATRMPDSSYSERTHGARTPRQQYQHEKDHENSKSLGSSLRFRHLAPPMLKSPIWNDGNLTTVQHPTQQLRYLSQTIHTTPGSATRSQHRVNPPLQAPKSSHRAYGSPPLLSPYPYWDGGIPGEGGDSSDEETRMFPTVANRDTWQGGIRIGKPSPVTYDRPFAIFQPLEEPMKLEDLWKGQDKTDRRAKKIFARNLARRWREASARNDLDEMHLIVGQARIARLPTANATTRRQIFGYRSPASSPMKGDALPSPRQDAHSECQSGRSSRLSHPLRPLAAENFCTQSQTGYVRTSRPQDNRHMISLPPTSLSSNDSLEFDDEMDADHEDELSPMLGHIGKSRCLEISSSQKSSYRPTHDLPEKCIAFTGRTLTKYPANGIPRLLSLSHPGRATALHDTDFRTPKRNPPPQSASSNRAGTKLPSIINLCSSAEVTPVPKRSVPMKDRMTSQIPKQRISHQARTRHPIFWRQVPRDNIDPEVARQQMHADRIIATEINVTHQQLFGETIGGAPEDRERFEAIKKKNAERKRDAILKEQLLWEEEARINEAARKRVLEEIRGKERLQKEREEKSKKAKRDADRKKQEEHEEALKERKRRKAAELIQAARAKEAAEAEALEKKKHQQQLTLINHLQIKVLKKDLQVKALQFSSLKGAKAGTPYKSKDSEATNPHSNLTNDEDSLFVSEAQPKITFREEVAGGRFTWDDRRRSEAIQRCLKPRSVSTSLDSSTTVAEPVQRKQKKPGASKKKWTLDDLEDSTENLLQPPILGNPTEPVALKPIEAKPTKFASKRSKSAKPPKFLPPVPLLSPPKKVYSSEVRSLEELSREKELNENKALEEEKKRRRNEERRRADSKKIEAKYRQKLLDEAVEGGFTSTEERLEILVDEYMKRREAKYLKLQAKKAGKGVGSCSILSSPFVSLNPKPATQALNEKHTLTQVETSQPSFLSSRALSVVGEDNQADMQVAQSENTTQVELKQRNKVAKCGTGGRFARAAARTSVAQFSDSDESEEDPDPTLETMLAAKRHQQFNVDVIQTGSQEGGVDTRCYEKELDQDLNEALSELPESAQIQTQPPSSSPTTTHPQSQSSTSIYSAIEQHFITANVNTADVKATGDATYDNMVRVYSVERMAVTNGLEGEAELIKKFTDRDDANEFCADLLRNLCNDKSIEIKSSSEFFNDDVLYTGTVVYNGTQSAIVRVTAKCEHPSKYAGLDVESIKKLHGEKVWVIKRELKKRELDDEGNVTISCFKEDAALEVYTDRIVANHKASSGLIDYLKPRNGNIDHEAEWANGWALIIREALKEMNAKEKLFEVEIEREDGQLAWLEWDEVKVVVEVRRTVGPKN